MTIGGAAPSSGTEKAILAADIKLEKQEAAQTAAVTQAEAKESLFDSEEKAGEGSPVKQETRLAGAKKLSEIIKARVGESVLVTPQEAEELAGRFNRDNPQYKLDKSKLAKLAEGLGTQIKGDSTPEAIITHIQVTLSEGGRLPDPAQVDKALEFLIKIMEAKVEKAEAGKPKEDAKAIHYVLVLAKTEHGEMVIVLANGKEMKNKDAIAEAEKTITVAGVIAELKPGTTVGEGLAHIREIINNPQDLKARLNYYKQKYALAPEPIKQEIQAILHHIGDRLRERLTEPPMEKETKLAPKSWADLPMEKETEDKSPAEPNTPEV